MGCRQLHDYQVNTSWASMLEGTGGFSLLPVRINDKHMSELSDASHTLF